MKNPMIVVHLPEVEEEEEVKMVEPKCHVIPEIPNMDLVVKRDMQRRILLRVLEILVETKDQEVEEVEEEGEVDPVEVLVEDQEVDLGNQRGLELRKLDGGERRRRWFVGLFLSFWLGVNLFICFSINILSICIIFRHCRMLTGLLQLEDWAERGKRYHLFESCPRTNTLLLLCQ